jgi:hypothetical protein
MSTTTKAERTEQAEAIADLRQSLRPGDTVWTSLKHVASSGMSRHIDVLTIPSKDTVLVHTWRVSKALGMKISPKTDALVVGGAGMDMGFHVVYSLSRTLYPDGFDCIGKGCPSNDHSNDYGDLAREYDRLYGNDGALAWSQDAEARSKYMSGRQDWIKSREWRLWSPDRHHTDGGYALNHRWLP